jgi:hypothetical protein
MIEYKCTNNNELKKLVNDIKKKRYNNKKYEFIIKKCMYINTLVPKSQSNSIYFNKSVQRPLSVLEFSQRVVQFPSMEEVLELSQRVVQSKLNLLLQLNILQLFPLSISQLICNYNEYTIKIKYESGQNTNKDFITLDAIIIYITINDVVYDYTMYVNKFKKCHPYIHIDVYHFNNNHNDYLWKSKATLSPDYITLLYKYNNDTELLCEYRNPITKETVNNITKYTILKYEQGKHTLIEDGHVIITNETLFLEIIYLIKLICKNIILAINQKKR